MVTKPELPRTLELPGAGHHGSGNESGIYYKVECRNTHTEPKIINDPNGQTFVIDSYWRQIPIGINTKSGLGIFIKTYDAFASQLGLYSHAVAEALRWQFVAGLEYIEVMGSLCVETRLVAVSLTKEYKTTEKGILDSYSSYDRTRHGELKDRFPTGEKG